MVTSPLSASMVTVMVAAIALEGDGGVDGLVELAVDAEAQLVVAVEAGRIGW